MVVVKMSFTSCTLRSSVLTENNISMAREHREIPVKDGNAEIIDMYSQVLELLL